MRSPEKRDDRHPYEKPAVESEEVFETLALTCTKTDPQCMAGPGVDIAQS